MLFISLSEKVYGVSAIAQSYEESIYKEINGNVFELARCEIHISIETESDGTWRNNSKYRGIVSISLVWYNASLFPKGLELFLRSPAMATGILYVKQTQNVFNGTLSPSRGLRREPVLFDFTFETYDVKYPVRQYISQSLMYEVINYSQPYKMLILTGVLDLPSVWITIMPDPQQKLQTEIIETIETLEKRLDSISNLLNYVIILVVTSIIIYIATNAYLKARKPETKTELKTT
jgi:hypothetical protein